MGLSAEPAGVSCGGNWHSLGSGLEFCDDISNDSDWWHLSPKGFIREKEDGLVQTPEPCARSLVSQMEGVLGQETGSWGPSPTGAPARPSLTSFLQVPVHLSHSPGDTQRSRGIGVTHSSSQKSKVAPQLLLLGAQTATTAVQPAPAWALSPVQHPSCLQGASQGHPGPGREVDTGPSSLHSLVPEPPRP